MIITGLVFSFAPENAKAAVPDWLSDPLGTTKTDSIKISSPENAIQTGVSILLTVAQISFVIMFLVAGVMYITAMGNEDGAEKAKKLLTQAIIGIIITFTAWTLSTWFLNTLNSGGSSTNKNVPDPVSMHIFNKNFN